MLEEWMEKRIAQLCPELYVGDIEFFYCIGPDKEKEADLRNIWVLIKISEAGQFRSQFQSKMDQYKKNFIFFFNVSRPDVFIYTYIKGKDKVIALQARCGPEGG